MNGRLHSGKAALHSLKELKKALQPLLNYANYSIYKVQDALRPLVLHNGMNIVPDEILAVIFEKAFESAPWSTRYLASVNRRFRDVALSLPKLWSVLPRFQGMEAFNLYLARSRDAGLIVDLGDVLTWYWEETMERTQRWESVTITRKDNKGVNLQSLSCPRTKTISVELLRLAGTPRRFEEFRIEWKLPALRHLTFRNATPALHPSALANLTSLELRLESHTTLCPFLNASLLRQLNLMDSLQVLSLTLRRTKFGEENPSLLCDLSSLIDFNIELSDEADTRDLRAFLDKINMKSVRRVSTKMGDEILAIGSYSSESLSSIFYTSSHRLRFPNMEAASLIVGPRRKDGEHGNLTMDYLLGHSALRNLYIRSPDFLFLEPQIFKDHKLSLRDVTIVGCNSGVRELLDYLLPHVNPDGTRLCNSIEKLRILGCVEVTMNYLLDFLLEDKIEWSPVVDYYSSQ